MQLLVDDFFLRMYDIREWVGRQPNQTRRMRSRLIGTNGDQDPDRGAHGVRDLDLRLDGGGDRGRRQPRAGSARDRGHTGGSEHGTVLFGLEQDGKAEAAIEASTPSPTRAGAPRSRPSRWCQGSPRLARGWQDAPLKLEEGKASPSARVDRTHKEKVRPWAREQPCGRGLPYEKWAINALVAVFLIVFLGVGLDWASVDNPISDALNQYFLTR